MKKIIIYGSGYLEILKLIDAINLRKPVYKILGFINDLEEREKNIWGHPILGGKEVIPELAKQRDIVFFNNVNSNFTARKKVFSTLKKNNCKTTSLIHPSIDMNYVKHGAGCIFPQGCLVGGGARIGNFLTCRIGSVISHDVTVGDLVFIGPGAICCGRSTIRSESFIGAGAIIINRVTIGRGSIIGAGSLVSKDIPDNVIAYGTPAKVIKKINREEFKF